MQDYLPRPVPGYEGLYTIALDGIIIRNKNCTIVRSRFDRRSGYMTTRLSKGGLTRTHYVHRLLALTFIENPHGLPIVNHVNGDKLDNSLVNLEWTDHRGNIIHAYRTGLIRRKLCRAVVDIRTGATFSSVREAAECYRIPYSSCKNYLNGHRRNPTSLRWAA